MKDLNIDTTIKAGVTKVERDVYKISIKQRNKKTVRIDCNTCTFSTHAEGNCPATELECYECRKTRHYSSSKACKYSDKKKKKKKKSIKTRSVKESDDESDTDT